jgi:hypothetical protein
MLEREFKRYAAYFRGWCQAFGEHERIDGLEDGVHWLLAEHQLGLVLPRTMIRPLYREVLLRPAPRTLEFDRDKVRIGRLRLKLDVEKEQPALAAIRTMLGAPVEAHIYLTSHLLYGGGNRIITFSARKPLIIIYKEIGSMRVRMA